MPNIIIIDDDRFVCKTLKRIFEKEGHTVDVAEDGEQGIQLVRRSNPDLVIIDIIMLNKEGIETIDELIKEYPDIKMIAISGGGLRLEACQYLDLALKIRVKAALKKPFDRDEIVNLANEIISNP